MKGNKQKNKNDKRAKDKADSLKKEWDKANENAKKANKKFVQKNRWKIASAAENASVVIIIGGIIYLL